MRADQCLAVPLYASGVPSSEIATCREVDGCVPNGPVPIVRLMRVVFPGAARAEPCTSGGGPSALPASDVAGYVGEARVVGEEGQAHHTGGAVAVLGDDDLGGAEIAGLGVVHLVAVDEHHDVG